MVRRTIAIMQPTYLPWIGYFDLIDYVDCFVFLDSVQFNKRSWQQRNRLKGAKGVTWLTVPVISKGRREQKIFEVEIDLSRQFQAKHLKTIANCYSKAPFFSQYIDELSTIFHNTHYCLAELNIELIQWFCKQLGISTQTLRSSDLNIEGKKTELLVNICEVLDANCYLSAEGSRVYIEENNLFETKNIRLAYHNYKHPIYDQLYGEFIPYLSILDLLFNKGELSLFLIQKGRE
ncbi:MAG: WbqC family protein [Cyanobacteriota bacterium]|nr:WbqC family protein [Cyanobacteriota bacterium]